MMMLDLQEIVDWITQGVRHIEAPYVYRAILREEALPLQPSTVV